jgi:hypothetical protein
MTSSLGRPSLDGRHQARQAAWLIRHNRFTRESAGTDVSVRRWRQKLRHARLCFDDATTTAIIAEGSHAKGALGPLTRVIFPVVAAIGTPWHIDEAGQVVSRLVSRGGVQ